MGQTTVIMPDETTILSMETNEIQALAIECGINPTGILEETLQGYLLTIRALFDGRQFNISRSDLVDLASVIAPNMDTSTQVRTSLIALNLALMFSAE